MQRSMQGAHIGEAVTDGKESLPGDILGLVPFGLGHRDGDVVKRIWPSVAFGAEML